MSFDVIENRLYELAARYRNSGRKIGRSLLRELVSHPENIDPLRQAILSETQGYDTDEQIISDNVQLYSLLWQRIDNGSDPKGQTLDRICVGLLRDETTLERDVIDLLMDAAESIPLSATHLDELIRKNFPDYAASASG